MTDSERPRVGHLGWVDLASKDLDRSKSFYTGLFGWDAFAVPDPAAGGYGFFLKDGKQVGGFGPTMSGEQVSAWNMYVWVDDADGTAERVRGGGGAVVGPMDVLGQGRLAVFTDPAGAFFSIWQGTGMNGFGVRNEPGTFCWTELVTPDTSGATAFYRSVFGWGTKANQSPSGTYYEWTLDGDSVAGMMDKSDTTPDDVPPHWLSYFMVEDVDATVARAAELGGNTLVPGMDIDLGRFAVLADPTGAAFGVMQFKEG